MKMRKPAKKSSNKIRKSNFEERFALMVSEYNKAKEILESMTEGTPEYAKQQKKCQSLFASAERFLNAN
ncbi:30S ribosomal protein S20 [Vibrio neptunius]